MFNFFYHFERETVVIYNIAVCFCVSTSIGSARLQHVFEGLLNIYLSSPVSLQYNINNNNKVIIVNIHRTGTSVVVAVVVGVVVVGSCCC